MMLQHGLSITMLLLSAGLAAGVPQGYGWLDRVVQFQKNVLFNEIKELAPINLKVELRHKSEGYEDSRHWDIDSVLRLLTLIRQSEKARPVYLALRRMLQPTRRIMMSMKQSMQKFPSIKGHSNEFYYEVDYTSREDNEIPPHVAVPDDQAIIIVSNPVEARLPSARISVKLLREILEARARAARQMPTTTKVVPWIDFVMNRTTTEGITHTTEITTTEESTEDPSDQATETGEDDESTTAEGDGQTNETGEGGETTIAAGDDGDSATQPEGETEAGGEAGTVEGEAEPGGEGGAAEGEAEPGGEDGAADGEAEA